MKKAKGKGRGRGRPFAKGKSGNPSGRPKELPGFLKWCRENSHLAAAAITRNLQDPDGRVSNRAAEVLWSYAWGPPKQQVVVAGDQEKPVQHELRHDPASPEELAAVLQVLGLAGALPAGAIVDEVGGSAGAEADEVLGAQPDDSPAGVPPPPRP